jgi:beta-glucosidase
MKKSRSILLCLSLIILPVETFSMRDFAAYVWQSLTNNSRSTHENPFAWPADALTNEAVSSLLCQSLRTKHYAEPFLFGASTSEHQCSKQCSPQTCSWERFAQERNLAHPHDSRHAIDLWKNYRAYINYARDVLGLNSLRFSIEWALVQPHGPEEFDQEALAHYADMFTYCIEKGITPIVCFHHYTDPCWFIDAGGFEREENTAFFVQFCVATYGAMMDALRTKTRARFHLSTMAQPLFATFNSPEGYAFKAYLQLKAPPGRKDKKGLSYVVNCLKNMMEAHVDVYYALKDRYEECDGVLKQKVKSPQVGFLKNIIQLDPAKKTAKHRWCSGITRMACAVGNLLQNECIYQFFTSGKFNVYVPTQVKVRHTNLAAIGALDFVGINYYSNRHMHFGSGVQETNESLKTDNSNYRFYPQGLYRAIVEVTEKLAGPLAIPMYVTENGIATRNDAKRSQFYREYLYALGRALEDGYDVRGYLTWTLADNYEWPNLEDNVPRVYGLCRVNPKYPERLILKEGAKTYVEILKAAS